MRIRPVLFLVALLCLLVTACGESDAPPVENGETAGDPEISILSPEPDAVFTDDRIEIELEVRGFTLDGDAIGGANVPGTGHWHVYLNGELEIIDVNSPAVLESVSAGVHDITVELVNNDHSPLSPRVQDNVVVMVE